ncbi:MAG: hypothetical protein DSY50_02615 [Desulfobulbus sp.]|nr:MAG: hypothetical protein DSY50_02615 [Desulfobulbus sp.]
MEHPSSFFRFYPCALLIVLLFFLPESVFAQTRSLPRVLIIHSYDPKSFISQPQDEGIAQGLAESGFVDGKSVEIKRFFMDTKRTYTRPDQIEARGKQALAMIEDFKPDLVFTVDDNATRTVMLPLVDSDIPVVFSGINAMPEMYNHSRRFMENRTHPGHNVTGVYEKLYIDKSMQLMAEVIRDLKKVVFIVDDSPTGHAIKKQMESELFVYGSDVLYSIYEVGSFTEYKKIIRYIDSNDEIGAYYPAAVRLKTKSGGTVTGRDILHWTLAHSHKPAFASSTLMCRIGAFGGVVVDFSGMGRQAARKGAQILKGTRPGDIAIEDASEFVLAFNIARAKQLGITVEPELLGAAAQLFETMDPDVTPRVFHLVIVQSDDKGCGFGADVEQGMLDELKRHGFIEGKTVKICRFNMKTRQTYRTPKQIHERGLAALKKVYRADPDLVITLGDTAAKEVMLPLVDSSYPVLFGSTMLPPEWYNNYRKFMNNRSNPGHNVSGITGEFQYAKGLKFVKVLFPKAKNIVLIHSGAITWKENFHSLLEQELGDCNSECGFTSIQLKEVSTVREFKELILKYNTDPNVDLVSAVFPAGLTYEDGSVCPVSEIVEWVVAHQTKPDFTFSDSWVRYGYLMAVAIDFEATGHQLGRQVLAVQRGNDPGDMAVQSPEDSYLVINRARAKRLGISLPVSILEAAGKVYDKMEPGKAH